MSERAVRLDLPHTCRGCTTTWATEAARSAHERQVHGGPAYGWLRDLQHRELADRRRVGNRIRMAAMRESAEGRAISRAWDTAKYRRQVATPEGRKRARASRNALWHRSRVREAGVLFVIRVEADSCGVCLSPLDGLAVFPDPRTTTIGHEPPLSRCARDGWMTVIERPEHFGCNTRKLNRYDCEMVA